MSIPAKAQRVETITRAQVEALDLYAWLVQRTGRGATRLSRDIYAGTVDAKRLYTGSQRKRIIARDTLADGTCPCAYCGKHITGIEGDWVYIDHVIPHTLGGQTHDDNAVLACSTCNSSKSDRIW